MPEHDDHNDQFLLAQVAQGDQAAFRRLFQKHSGKLVEFLYNLFRSRPDAEDGVQEIFAAIWQRRSSLVEVKDFNAFIFRASKNHFLNALRKGAKIELMESFDAEAATFLGTPQTLLEQKQLNEFLREAKTKLPRQQRIAFTLSRDENLSIAEMARLMEVSESTAKEHVSKALKTLRKLYFQYSNLHLLVAFILFYPIEK